MPLLSAESFARPRKGPLKHADPLIAQYRRALEQAHVEHDRLTKWRETMPKEMDGSAAEAEVLDRLKQVEVLIVTIPKRIHDCQLTYASMRLGSSNLARPPAPPDYGRLWAENPVPSSASLHRSVSRPGEGSSSGSSVAVPGLPAYEDAPPSYHHSVTV